MSEKGPKDFTDIVFQIQVKEMLSVAPGNQSGTEPDSQLHCQWESRNFPSFCCVLSRSFVTWAGNPLRFQALTGDKHGPPLAGWLLIDHWIYKHHSPSAVLHIPAPYKADS